MKFTVDTFNHGCKSFIEDYANLLQLTAGVAETVECSAGNCVILCEYFDNNQVAAVRRMRDNGTDVVIVSTEFVTGATYNNFDNTKPDPASWKRRYETFCEAAQYARAVWSSTDEPDQIRLQQEAVGAVPVVKLPFPHFDAFSRLEHRQEKDIDVLFWGVHTAHRGEVMARLGKAHTVSSPGYTPDAGRCDLIARAKLCLNVRQTPSWRFPSKMRYWLHLSNASAIVGEQCPVRNELDPIVPTYDGEQLDEACRELLASGDWARLADEQYQRFSDEHPAALEVAELVERSFA